MSVPVFVSKGILFLSPGSPAKWMSVTTASYSGKLTPVFSLAWGNYECSKLSAWSSSLSVRLGTAADPRGSADPSLGKKDFFLQGHYCYDIMLGWIFLSSHSPTCTFVNCLLFSAFDNDLCVCVCEAPFTFVPLMLVVVFSGWDDLKGELWSVSK